MNYETSVRADADVAVIDRRAPRRRALIIGALVVVAALALAFFLFGRDKKAAPVTAKTGPAPEVTVVTPGRQPVAGTVTATGNLAARVEMPVGEPGAGGLVTRVLVEPGQWVQAGQILATVDRQVQVQNLAQLAAQVNVARADAVLAQQELERAQTLVGRGFISKADVDRRTATRDAANARIKVAQAALNEARERTGQLDVRAPAAGLVLTRQVEPGQIVSSASGTLFRIAKGGEMELRAQLSETDLAAVRVGSLAKVTPVGSDQSYSGQVWQVSPVIDPATRQGVARIALSYKPGLRPGGFAQAELVTGEVNAPLLPESAVLSDQTGNYVYIVDGANKAQRRPVRTGQVTDKGVTILDGLTGQEKVVLSAGAFLNPGETVRPRNRALAR